MKNTVLMSMVAAMVLLLAGVAFSWWDGPVMGYGPGYYDGGVKAETVKKFQKETLSLRDELMTKKLELREEYDKPNADTGRVIALKKEIVDIQAKIQTVADKYDMPGPMNGMQGRGIGRGMMAGAGCGCSRSGQ